MVQWPSNKVPSKLWDTFSGDVSVATKLAEMTISLDNQAYLIGIGIETKHIPRLSSIFITLAGDHAEITPNPLSSHQGWSLTLTRAECALLYERILKPYVRFGTIYGYPGPTNTYSDSYTVKYPR